MNFLSVSLKAREKAIAVSNSLNDSCFRKNSSGSNTNKNNYKFSSDKSETSYNARNLITNMKENTSNMKCPFCDSSDHTYTECVETHNLLLQLRKDLLLKKGACFKCLEMKKHMSKFCKKNVICDHC